MRRLHIGQAQRVNISDPPCSVGNAQGFADRPTRRYGNGDVGAARGCGGLPAAKWLQRPRPWCTLHVSSLGATLSRCQAIERHSVWETVSGPPSRWPCCFSGTSSGRFRPSRESYDRPNYTCVIPCTAARAGSRGTPHLYAGPTVRAHQGAGSRLCTRRHAAQSTRGPGGRRTRPSESRKPCACRRAMSRSYSGCFQRWW